MLKIAGAMAAVMGFVAGSGALAQEAPKPTAVEIIKRLQLQRVDYPADAYASMIYSVEVIPGGLIARHTHPGVEMGYVLEGEGVLQVEGQAEVAMKPGVTYKVPPGVPHAGKNNGAAPLKIAATYVVEKDKPLATPAPLP